MRTQLLAATIIASALAGSAQAQNAQGPYRRFTDNPTDTNRNDRIVYAPLGWAFTESRPARQAYEFSSATWYLQPVGSQGVRANKVLDKAEYTLERFEAIRGDGNGPQAFRIVISRIGGQDEPAPEIRVVESKSGITSRATAQAERTGSGTRYTFLVREPLEGLGVANQPSANRYEIRFMASGGVNAPASIARKPTFGGEDPELRSLTGPPQLPRAERVAGKRIEYRSARSSGEVVTDPKVAGRRQEYRDRR